MSVGASKPGKATEPPPAGAGSTGGARPTMRAAGRPGRGRLERAGERAGRRSRRPASRRPLTGDGRRVAGGGAGGSAPSMRGVGGASVRFRLGGAERSGGGIDGRCRIGRGWNAGRGLGGRLGGGDAEGRRLIGRRARPAAAGRRPAASVRPVAGRRARAGRTGRRAAGPAARPAADTPAAADTLGRIRLRIPRRRLLGGVWRTRRRIPVPGGMPGWPYPCGGYGCGYPGGAYGPAAVRTAVASPAADTRAPDTRAAGTPRRIPGLPARRPATRAAGIRGWRRPGLRRIPGGAALRAVRPRRRRPWRPAVRPRPWRQSWPPGGHPGGRPIGCRLVRRAVERRGAEPAEPEPGRVLGAARRTGDGRATTGRSSDVPQNPHILNLAGFSSPQAGQCTTSIAEESTSQAPLTPRSPARRVARAPDDPRQASPYALGSASTVGAFVRRSRSAPWSIDVSRGRSGWLVRQQALRERREQQLVDLGDLHHGAQRVRRDLHAASRAGSRRRPPCACCPVSAPISPKKSPALIVDRPR